MIVDPLSSSTRRQQPRYALGLMHLFLAALQPVIINADLNGVEACQNRCFTRPECNGVGGGLCCQWDDDAGLCLSNVGEDTCPGTASMSPPPDPSIDCPPKTTSLVESTHRNLSDAAAETAPTASPTNYYEKSRDFFCNKEPQLPLDTFLCDGFTIEQLTTLIINYKITSALPILGSSYVIQDVIRDPKKRKESTYHRIMLALSCSDIILSFFGPFLGPWVMPQKSQLFATGSFLSCGIAGFFMTWAMPCTPLYNCSLSTFYLLRLKYNWVSREVKAIEKWLLLLPLFVGLVVAIITAATSSLGPFGFTCA